MQLTTEQKLRVTFLILQDKKEEAIAYLQRALNISREEALVLLVESQKRHDPASLTESEQLNLLNKNRKGAMLIQIIGFIFLAVAAYLLVRDFNFSKRALHVQGIVTEFYSSEVSDNEKGGYYTVYSPVFQYKVNDIVYVKRSSMTSSEPNLDLNTPVGLLVDPQKPDVIVVDLFGERWGLAALFGTIGVVCLLLTYAVHRYIKSKNKAA